METTIAIVNVPSFSFRLGARGFHVYQKDWVPFVRQAVAFEREPGNVHDCFAVAINSWPKFEVDTQLDPWTQ